MINVDGNYIIVHGSFGSCDGNWFPWLKQKLESKKLIVDVPQMPVGVGNQNYENWEKEYPFLQNILNMLIEYLMIDI